MRPRHKHRFWRICRIYFRRFRITVWFVLLLLVGAVVYLNQVGLPGFVKKPLLQKLRARGLELQFSRLRLLWYEGLVADNVRVGRADDPGGPQLTLGEVQLLLNPRALTRLQLQIDALVLRRGRLLWPVAGASQGSQVLAVEGIQTHLRFLPNDQWALDDFKAAFAGADIRLSGLVTNASAIRDWQFLHGQPAAPTPADVWQRRLRRVAETLERIHFSTPPDLRLSVQGDARDLQSFNARLLVSAPGAETPWGAVSQGRFSARVFPADTNGSSRAEVRLEAAEARTLWANITNFHLGLQFTSIPGRVDLVNGALRLSATEAQTPWAEASNAIVTATWVHSITNPVPLSGHGRFACDSAHMAWGTSRDFELDAHLDSPGPRELPSPPPAPWAWWTNLQPYSLDWQCHLINFHSSQIVLDEISCGGRWRTPELAVTNLEVRLYEAGLTGQANLNVLTRAVRAELAANVDPHHIAPVLPPAGSNWLAQFTWEKSPQLQGGVSLVLPAWTNRQPDWREEVLPTLQLRGQFDLQGQSSYREVQAAAVRSHFVYSNRCWHLPDMTVTRPEGRLEAEHRANERTKEFYWRVASSVDPRILRPLLGRSARAVFDLLELSEPPAVQAEVWGLSHDPERVGFKGRVALTNFSFRGQSASSLEMTVQYSNRVLQFLEPQIERGTQHIRADALTADFNRHFVYLTNGFSTAEPLVIARAIGAHVARAIEPYQFSNPPVGHVYGTIPMHGEEGADLHFDLAGGPFHWWKFHAPRIAGHVHWAGLLLELSDVRADFYSGRANGSALFGFTPGQPTTLQFGVATTNLLLQELMADLSPRTNHLEGRLTGSVIVSRGNTEDWRSINGYGGLDLRDGLIWDIPLFGIFTPVLNGISPGLGNSRANFASCAYVITNGVIRTENLDIRSPAVRLKYRGTVDLQEKVNARVDAELLHDMWLVGPVVSTVLWPVTKMFEYKVEGTLAEPKMEPVFFVPRVVLFPFHPLRSLKSMLPEESPTPGTNAPAGPSPTRP